MKDLLTKLDEIEQRAEKATPGPWRKFKWGDGSSADGSANVGQDELEVSIVRDTYEPDAAFIAAARTDIPALTKALRRAAECLESLREPAKNGHSATDVVACCAATEALADIEKILSADTAILTAPD